MSEEQRLRWAERLFWDLNFLPQMGQSGTPGAGGGGGRRAGALSSLSSKHLQKEDHSDSELTLSVTAVQMFKFIVYKLNTRVSQIPTK